MADAETMMRRVQVANLPPADSGRGVARLPRQADDRAGTGRGRRDRDRRQARHRGARDPSLWRRRGARHHPPRRAPARQCRGRVGRLHRSAQGRLQARDAGRVRAGGEQCPASGIGGGAPAQLRGPALHRGRHRRHRGAPAGQCRHAREYPPIAQRPRLRAAGSAADGGVGGAARDRPHRRQDRGRAAPRI